MNTTPSARTKGLILVVEDDPALLLMMRYNLEQRGYRVETAADGESALLALETSRPDAAVLDWMLPGLSGLDLCRRIRAHPSMRDLPVLLLTARTDERDAIRGLDTGADDYLVKPCSIDTLDARLRALLRRHQSSYDVLSFADLTMDPETHRVERAGRNLTLGPTEFRLLDLLIRNPRKVFSREDLLKRIWGQNIHVEIRTIDVHIRRLRKAINGPGELDLVRTVRAAGYALDDVPEGDT
ncbi:response regulator [Gluconobacter wancherniae]|uniref:DNA-binding response regulator n=1 Tax=Gluconobacter wancherniae NBRC 103581 TaxID=656744 RepID=A0A511B9Z6_9PROT|nr:response regulator [Gluconobacter wancherniae]MBF0854765.1 response regulator [Gluconobacter wancherniae]MBS1089346.1 response regulator [Gluconobacter wancherniae]GBD57836.1 DNA-binding response regulator [Gluconobacter wancherniae NBRC 103581]GBR61958.1 phosphate regulon response regulator PhoB [Gluconobacter wancherniae NBRC 103581]GEK94637.1 DNA-binding response regulator [Gluconobacter wancherniae NBRC 103581]